MYEEIYATLLKTEHNIESAFKRMQKRSYKNVTDTSSYSQEFSDVKIRTRNIN